MKETSESYFPRLESVRDSLGNMWKSSDFRTLHTQMTARPGDTIEYVVTASDPMEENLQIVAVVKTDYTTSKWQDGFVVRVTFEQAHVGISCFVSIMIRSQRGYHAQSIRVGGVDGVDDMVTFYYDVLPPR